MSPEEQVAIEKLQATMAENNKLCLMMCQHLLRMDEQELRNCGYKTQEQGIVSSVKDCLKKNEKLQKDHVKRFPD